MTTLIGGADRDGLRLVLVQMDRAPIERILPQPARERHERELIEQFLADNTVSWEQIDRFVALSLPHSHTSVRVLSTILKTTAWYLGRPFGVVALVELAELSLAELILAAEVAQPPDA